MPIDPFHLTLCTTRTLLPHLRHFPLSLTLSNLASTLMTRKSIQDKVLEMADEKYQFFLITIGSEEEGVGFLGWDIAMQESAEEEGLSRKVGYW